ncbi:hypothetical protein PtA15_12A153 [Puccinia triticina]|uniref:Uncharacterized protein n=1 Tax=Puccinia triticina TaxID=208348 RepID=A0ABY7D1M9_9BASI|nr:uncharacterized protein PtA15_12A153 [Puccinia triticina]WAQ90167.1 hypothetical protein PtA15_12A153 [Puccinia triticina]
MTSLRAPNHPATFSSHFQPLSSQGLRTKFSPKKLTASPSASTSKPIKPPTELPNTKVTPRTARNTAPIPVTPLSGKGKEKADEYSDLDEEDEAEDDLLDDTDDEPSPPPPQSNTHNNLQLDVSAEGTSRLCLHGPKDKLVRWLTSETKVTSNLTHESGQSAVGPVIKDIINQKFRGVNSLPVTRIASVIT